MIVLTVIAKQHGGYGVHEMPEMQTTIRHATADDAAVLLELKQALDRETAFMKLEPDERTTTVAEERRALMKRLAKANSTLLVAEGDGELAGYLEAEGGEFRRNWHAAYNTIGVRQGYAGRGVGAALLRVAEAWTASSSMSTLWR